MSPVPIARNSRNAVDAHKVKDTIVYPKTKKIIVTTYPASQSELHSPAVCIQYVPNPIQAARKANIIKFPRTFASLSIDFIFSDTIEIAYKLKIIDIE